MIGPIGTSNESLSVETWIASKGQSFFLMEVLDKSMFKGGQTTYLLHHEKVCDR